MFTKEDKEQFKEMNCSIEEVQAQMDYFHKGFPYLNVEKSATIGDGITTFDQSERDRYFALFNKKRPNLEIVKFVPASGAASRMFKPLYEYLESGILNKEAEKLVSNLDQFAFYNQLQVILAQKHISQNDTTKIVDSLLNESGLNYGNLPKALITVHQYDNHARTALEEHLIEGGNYSYMGENDQTIKIHFTTSPNHQLAFKEKIKTVVDKYEKQFNKHYEISYSQQKSSTDTIAVDLDNNPIRDDNGQLVFRPGGHGALLENLNQISADIIFIKNIDNIVQERFINSTISNKSLLAGILLEKRDIINNILANQLPAKDETAIDTIQNTITEIFGDILPIDFKNLSIEEKNQYLINKLNRPLRVCGMVKNDGEPGGGPVWVRDSDGGLSLQIAEASQIAPERVDVLKSGTHFNPVDLVCCTKDYKGNKFDLMKFRDPNTGFISIKSRNGKNIKIQELPGLWNGSMALWNTIFVEVPIITFNPIKTVNDLLRETHLYKQSQQ